MLCTAMPSLAVSRSSSSLPFGKPRLCRHHRSSSPSLSSHPPCRATTTDTSMPPSDSVTFSFDSDGPEGADSIEIDVAMIGTTGKMKLDIKTKDRDGLLTIISQALNAANATIENANVTTTPDTDMVNDTFVITPLGPEPLVEAEVRTAVISALLDETVPSANATNDDAEVDDEETADVQVMRFDAMPENMLVVVIEGKDRPGLLAKITSTFAELKLKVHSAEITTTKFQTVRNRFAVIKGGDSSLTSDDIKERVLAVVDA
mmetsp:Transcript_13083/g.32618  ORF Transcript_13083/g.32618 Transcript_13083/m.32618 type:complete len:261 (+) Transcript_13083:124-906(+)|eukprot:CAMPEP_0119194012 /NCGR_PEP_ID=MMETSP1316-20130426/3950_1 /TAXON_ID=41880 /ORGANISM="Pycnococcus provasolii, Strain RCC2336" /LENGTH=260 /DNA_ID=CAMNT_0007189311 /DNA_START=168 /DNA_END=950 /DNA_ORIENTATION=+